MHDTRACVNIFSKLTKVIQRDSNGLCVWKKNSVFKSDLAVDAKHQQA